MGIQMRKSGEEERNGEKGKGKKKGKRKSWVRLFSLPPAGSLTHGRMKKGEKEKGGGEGKKKKAL